MSQPVTDVLIEFLPKLPQRPSALIKLACDDAESVFRNPAYRLNLSDWHEPNDDGTCTVCFAGAVMVNTLNADPESPGYPEKFWADHRALYALNDFRKGGFAHLERGITTLVRRGLTANEAEKLYKSGACDIDVPYPKPGTKGVAFLRAMRKVAAKLEAVGW